MKKTLPVQLTIGQVAKQAQVGIDTIRFYERKGIVGQPSRRESGYRQYDHSMVHQIQFIKRTQELGFTLKEIKDLLGLKAERQASCMAVKSRSDKKLAEIEEKIRNLKRMKAALSKISDACAKRCTTEECPIVNCFAESGCCA